ncbi:hypothetical protein CHLRE_04g217978v5 [Chlamydomonas reinhardtii]|uniref:Endonuclease/exonuclease/phosphatase domain-containing protein n=1 Tax=Chlamydomonas reinhardtii TaxID=3055 RepID=A0A2K3DTN5_CHLRE|nr:uncharacterized protein CHLRE_04g217978v5 [Chlamydomonas reinhardtii]PNW83882.1 hypothetical protein CHLRE_04g217978v5 [Chlamydomonas reinhardtii]
MQLLGDPGRFRLVSQRSQDTRGQHQPYSTPAHGAATAAHAVPCGGPAFGHHRPLPGLAADSTPAGGGNTASPFFSPGLQLHLALSTHSLAHGVQDLTTQPQGPSLPTYPVLLVGATTGLPEGEQLSSAGVREVTSAALSVLDTMCRQGNQPQLLQGHSLHSTGRPSCTFAGLAFSRRATSTSKAAFTVELMCKSPLAVPLQRGQAVLTVHVPVDTRPIIPGTYTVTVKMVGGPVWGAFRGRTDLVLQAGGYPTTSDPSNLACAYVVSEQCAKSVGPKGEPQAPAGQGITNHIFACVRGPVWDPQLSHLHCAKFEMPGEEPMQVEVRGAPQAAETATTAAAGSPALAAAGVADLGGNTLGVARPMAAMATAADIVDHVGDVQMQEAAGLGDAAAAAGGASGPHSGAPPPLPVLVAGGSNRAAAAALRAERQQQPSSQQRVAAGGLSGVQPAAGVGGPQAARPRPAGAGPAGVQQQHSGAPAPRPPLDQRAATGQDQEQTAVMQRYLAELADLNLQQKRRVQQQQQQELQRQGQSPRTRTGSQVVVLATVLVVGGDWNCVTDASQEAASSPSRAAGAPQLASLLAQFSLVDPWASKCGGAKGYTHPATPKPATPARLDRWYVSATAAPWVVDVARTYGAPGDHNGVLLTLSLPDLPHAHREQWRLPTYLLFHPSLRLELEQRLEAHVAANPVASTGDGACTQWEADKFFLREAATSIHRRHARQTRDGLHGVVLAADAAAALADRPGASAAQHQAAAMANLAVREERAAAAAASHNARAALMEEHGERGTRWFHRQADEPAAGAQEPITHLKVPGQPAPVALTGPGTRNTVSAAAAAMYSSTSPTGLFRVQPVNSAHSASHRSAQGG